MLSRVLRQCGSSPAVSCAFPGTPCPEQVLHTSMATAAPGARDLWPLCAFHSEKTAELWQTAFFGCRVLPQPRLYWAERNKGPFQPCRNNTVC